MLIDAGATADFETPEGYHTYAEHPEHVDVVVNVAKPMTAASARVQYEV